MKGDTFAGRKYRAHPDGYNMLDYLSGKTNQSPRNEFWYVNDDGQIVAARWQDWKVVFLENRGEAFGVWREPFVEFRVPFLFNLRRDPFEKRSTTRTPITMVPRAVFVIVPIQRLAATVPRNHEGLSAEPDTRRVQLSKIEEQIKAAAGGR